MTATIDNEKGQSTSFVDKHGLPIKVGDMLSWDYGDYHDDDEAEPWMKEPVFKVVQRENGSGLYGVGLHQTLYLHSFRFKHCAVIPV